MARWATTASGQPWRVVGLSLVMGSAAVVVYLRWVVGAGGPTSLLSLPWWSIAVAFAASEILVVHVEGRGDAHTYSLSEVPLVVGLFALSPTGLVLARMVGSAAALIFHRRQAPVKLAFNVVMFCLEASVIVVVFRQVLGTHAATGPWAWGAAFAAILAGTLLGAASVSLAIALHEGTLPWPRVTEMFLTGIVLSGLTNTSLGLVTVIVLAQDVRAGALLVVLAAIVFLSYRGHTSLRRNFGRLEQVYDFTRMAGQSLEVEATVAAILTKARDVLRADRAELTVLDASSRPVRMTLADDGRLRVERATEGSPDGLRARVVATGVGLLAPAPCRDERLRDGLRDEGMKDAMVVPLLAEGALIGTMLVADRLGTVITFDNDDLRMFETLANHASVSITNGRLVEQLRVEAAEKEHQSRHDTLTGLPNRVLFQEEVSRAIEQLAGRDRQAAVLLLDLDSFKDINDTLGHHNGDLLLHAFSTRLRAAMDGRDTVARLGGDEFAVLLPDEPDDGGAERTAVRILGLLEEPFVLQGLTIDVAASIGVAMYPVHGSEPATLLQRAEVAMYAAKGSAHGWEVYSPAKDDFSTRRLTLAGELRSAMESGRLAVHYQPKADLRTRRLVGVEALLRWPHAEHGMVAPDEFIPIAEHTGLIRPLTLYVLSRALRQCAAWHEAGWNLTMAVNLSVRSLLDEELPIDVARLLEETGVPAGSLTLEITESSMMAEPARMTDVLDRLSALGVLLSIDDFGTGYSSLGYLKRLPVSEVKIDKSFVQHMATDENDFVIVRSTIDLGHNLGLRVVAEGVEDEEAWRLLTELGCDVVQGYYLSRPAPAIDLEHSFDLRGVNHDSSAGALSHMVGLAAGHARSN